MSPIRPLPSGAVTQACVIVATVLLVGPVLGCLLLESGQSLLAGELIWPETSAVVRTLAVCASIGLLATMLGWLPARVLAAHRRSRLVAVCLVPLLMPPYLAYAGYSIVRDPSWVVGDWLASLAAHGHAWVTISFGRALAILGLALWAWPIAAVVLASTMKGAESEDALMLDAPRARRAWERLRMNSAGLSVSVVVVALLMLGSAVPLHLAQIETIAIDLWRQMSETPPEQWGTIWLRGWPVFIPALLAAILVPGMVGRLAYHDGPELSRFRTSPASVVAAWIIWGMATLGPLSLFLFSLHSVRSLGEFWRLSGPGVVSGLSTAAGTAAISGLLAMLFAIAIDQSQRSRPIAQGVVLSVWVFAAIIPGVFIGAALVAFQAHLPRNWQQPLVVQAHIARFAYIPLIVATVSAFADPPELRDLRLLEGATSVRSWLATCLPRRLVIIPACLAAGMMGFHEIEATTMLLPPGRGNLAQQILGYLHYSRMEEMAAAAVYLIGGGLVVSLFISSAIVRGTKGS